MDFKTSGNHEFFVALMENAFDPQMTVLSWLTLLFLLYIHELHEFARITTASKLRVF